MRKLAAGVNASHDVHDQATEIRATAPESISYCDAPQSLCPSKSELRWVVGRPLERGIADLEGNVRGWNGTPQRALASSVPRNRGVHGEEEDVSTRIRPGLAVPGGMFCV